MLILHILIALSSIVFTGFTFINPSKTKFKTSYTLVAVTLATGTYLVILAPSHMVSACFTGIVYLAFVTAGLVSAHKKFAKEVSEG